MSSSDTQEDDYYDAVSAAPAAISTSSGSPVQAQVDTSANIYFELEKEVESEEEGESVPNYDTLPVSDKYKTAPREMEGPREDRRNVMDKAKMFEQRQVNPVEDRRQPKLIRSSGRKESGQAVTFSATAVASADAEPPYEVLWPAHSHSQAAPRTDLVYDVARPLPVEMSGWKKTSADGGHTDSVGVSPVVAGSQTHVRTVAESKRQTGNTLLTDSTTEPKIKAQEDSQVQAERKKQLHYSWASVPVMEDPAPGQATEGGKSGEMLSSFSQSANRGCKTGAGAAVPVNFLSPDAMSHASHQSGESEYSRLYFQSTTRELTASEKERLEKQGYSTLANVHASLENSSHQPEVQDPDSDGLSEEEDLSFDWGSEFDEDSSYQGNVEEYLAREGATDAHMEAPDKPLPQKPGKGKNLVNKSVDLGPEDTRSTVCLPVTLDPEKHPPPQLPPPPAGLTDSQVKRRCVIDLVISSERSYLDSLERIVKQYRGPILSFLPQPKSALRPVFAELNEIITHHKMFQIELAEAVRRWDMEEKIGDIFTASFSKTMLVNAYSIYVNNFAAAMEEIRTLQRSRQSFDTFLKKQEKSNADRLSIFGLMVKPVQRFPQFIMCLQDLLKYTPQTHHDRRALQLALTELENVTHKLNERKRHSEQRFQAQHALQLLTRQKVQHLVSAWNLDLDPRRRLLRTDTVEQVYGEFGNMKCKERRLVLMNDLVLCVKVLEKEQAGYRVERLALRWMAKLRDLELKDTAITPDMQSVIKKEPEKIQILTLMPDKPEEDPFHLYADLAEMLHDFTVLGQMAALVSSLKRSYGGHGLSEELVHEVSRDLQRMIQIKDEQLRLVNSCSIVLVDNSKSEKPHYVLQTATAAIKQDWCLDFLMARLALDKSNCEAWDGPVSSEGVDADRLPAYFMKCVSVDVPRNYTKIRCAVPIFLNPENAACSIGVQHLWVCSSTADRGQVAILSIHNSKPALTESFRACDCDITAAELVPGCGQLTRPGDYLFAEDTVWVATARCDVLVWPLSSKDSVHREPLAVLRLPAITVSIKFVDERVFCAFNDGVVTVLSRQEDGSWNTLDTVRLGFGSSPVRLHFEFEEDLWLSCGSNITVLEIDSLRKQREVSLGPSSIDHVVKSGVGVWVSAHDSPVIRLFHSETLEALQEMNIGNIINRIRAEKLWTMKDASEAVVTALGVSKGLLWLGTSIGVILSLPLPRLSDGVPLYRGSPCVSLHSHAGPVKFFTMFPCAQATLELRRASSLRHTLSMRPSRRNLAREQMELEESEAWRNAANVASLSPVEESTRGSGGTFWSEEEGLLQEGKEGEEGEEGKEGEERKEGEEGKEISSVPSTSDVQALMKWERDTGFQSGLIRNGSIELAERDAGSKGGSSHVPATSKGSDGQKKLSHSKEGLRSSQDDSSVVFRRRRSRVPNAERQSRTLSFRSELANRIIVQSETMSLSNGDLSELQEVEMLYENLLEEEIDHEATMSSNGFDETKESAMTCVVEEHKEGKNLERDEPVQSDLPCSHVTDTSCTDPTAGPAKTPPLSHAHRELAASQSASGLSLAATISPGVTSSPSLASVVSSSSSGSHQDDPLCERKVGGSSLGSAQTVTLGNTLRRPTTAHGNTMRRSTTAHGNTMRRSTTPHGSTVRRPSSNAVIVLTGGDGYRDLDMSRNQHKSEDACVMFWLYKF
ncbi:rho guanine nucleotide exchange factor 10-like protein [Aplysia californica]|uniref:Rho guanine nucleotide exchange factor 10-like protein n=1 Tax=Aplysia californica TaxID=6500 RepID=A0ABM1W3A0_APLCA|nr:rho guanine nucleotide exchange factor 10-like protein [Aplysia californica]